MNLKLSSDLSSKNERASVFQKEFREDLKDWIKNDRKIALKVIELIEAIMRTPFDGIGKPEPLKYLGTENNPRTSACLLG